MDRHIILLSMSAGEVTVEVTPQDEVILCDACFPLNMYDKGVYRHTEKKTNNKKVQEVPHCRIQH